MGAVTQRAQEIVAALTAADLPAASDVRKVKLPGLLVVPVPSLQFTILDNSSVEATFKVWAITGLPGDLRAAEALERLVFGAAEVLDVDTTEPGAYQLPGASDPLPAVELTLVPDVIDVTT